MNPTQLPLVVEAVLILAAAALGFLVGRKGRPYGKVKLGFHLFFFLWFGTGYYFIVRTLAASPWTLTSSLVLVMGIALAAQLAGGLLLLFRKGAHRILPKVHGTAALVLLLADIAAWVSTGLKP